MRGLATAQQPHRPRWDPPSATPWLDWFWACLLRAVQGAEYGVFFGQMGL